MKRQMTDAPMNEIASGRKMKVLASDSRLTRSTRPAISRPSRTLPPVPTMSQMMLLRMIADELRLKQLLVVRQRIAVRLHGEAGDDRPDRRIDEVDDEQGDRRDDEDPGQDPALPRWDSADRRRR